MFFCPPLYLDTHNFYNFNIVIMWILSLINQSINQLYPFILFSSPSSADGGAIEFAQQRLCHSQAAECQVNHCASQGTQSELGTGFLVVS